MASELTKVAQGDRARPGSLSDFLALAVSTGLVAAASRMPLLHRPPTPAAQASAPPPPCEDTARLLQSMRAEGLPHGCARGSRLSTHARTVWPQVF